jgi:hypothetical protein
MVLTGLWRIELSTEFLNFLCQLISLVSPDID